MNILEQLPEDARQIDGALNWVDRKGNLYGVETRTIKNRHTGEIHKHKNWGKYFKYNTFLNKHNGYIYGNIKYIIDKENDIYEIRQRRLHIVIAETFIENSNDYPIVGHRNNIKSDNRVENLYWTTWKENTQKAVADGLLVNDKGYDDSQSQPVTMFDTYTNEIIAKYGSAREAARQTNIPLNTILRQSKYKKPVRKPFYFRFQDDMSAEPPIVVGQYDLSTNELLGTYWNTWEASRQTGINSRTILEQCKNNKIPKWTKSGTYFLYR